MKKIVLLIMIMIAAFSINIRNANASNETFFEGDYAGNIYTRRTLHGNTRYQRTRFFKEETTGSIAYCIEPFVDFGNGIDYDEVTNIDNLSDDTLQKLTLLANYGYMYPGHEDIKWYAITQQLIWKIAEPNATYEFTDGLNGNTIYPYEEEMNELLTLVNNHLITPNFGSLVFEIVEGEELILTDQNQVLAGYESSNPNIEITNNQIKVKALKEGIRNFSLQKVARNHEKPALFYYKADEQKIMTLGNARDMYTGFTVKVKKTELEITKVDKDTNSTTPSGEGKLIGAKYGLYNQDNKLIKELIIGKDNKASIKNIPFGTYTLKEITPGDGYQLDKNEYKIDITSEKTSVKLELANEIIKKKLQIYKKYGTSTNMTAEENVTFDIWNSKDEYVTSITTDSNGYAEIELPYGTYTVKQKNSKENYKPVEDFKIEIKEEDQELKYELYDYKIEVPNTAKKEDKIHSTCILLLLGGLYVYKRKNL